MIARTLLAAAALGGLVFATPLAAATPRELLTQAAFQATDKQTALALANQAIAAAEATLARTPNDREALLQRGIGIGDRARLTHSPGDARTTRTLFEALAAAYPRDPEAQLAVASWHLDTIAAGMLATTVLGAKRAIGLQQLDKAVALGGQRPFITGMAAMMRIRLDPMDVARARALAEQAVAAPATTQLDRIVQRDAQALLVPLKAGDGKGASKLARTLLPFGRLE